MKCKQAGVKVQWIISDRTLWLVNENKNLPIFSTCKYEWKVNNAGCCKVPGSY